MRWQASMPMQYVLRTLSRCFQCSVMTRRMLQNGWLRQLTDAHLLKLYGSHSSIRPICCAAGWSVISYTIRAWPKLWPTVRRLTVQIRMKFCNVMFYTVFIFLKMLSHLLLFGNLIQTLQSYSSLQWDTNYLTTYIVYDRSNRQLIMYSARWLKIQQIANFDSHRVAR